jgi:hypothetical protein
MNDEQQAKGFQFPGVFEIMAAGPAEARWKKVIPRELAAAGLTVLQETCVRAPPAPAVSSPSPSASRRRAAPTTTRPTWPCAPTRT